jgi:hypothetical protein
VKVTGGFEGLRNLYCKEISIYVFPEKKLRGLNPNFHIHVSLGDLYIPTISPPIFLLAEYADQS